MTSGDWFLIAIIAYPVILIYAMVIINKKLDKNHEQFNSRMDEFIKLAEEAALAKGLLQGRSEHKTSKTPAKKS